MLENNFVNTKQCMMYKLSHFKLFYTYFNVTLDRKVIDNNSLVYFVCHIGLTQPCLKT